MQMGGADTQNLLVDLMLDSFNKENTNSKGLLSIPLHLNMG
jgi:hypothetical protein